MEKLRRIAIGQSILEQYATPGPFRMTKSEATYGAAFQGRERCGTCRHSIRNVVCEEIHGYIDRNHVCDLYDGK